MSSTGHPSADLSAYLDGALDAADQARLDAHLSVCAECRRHLSELRAVVSLVAQLAAPLPSRSLVPHLWSPPVWLAPLRTLSAVASGGFVMVFVASILLTNVTQLSAGGTAAAPRAATPAGPAALAPAAASSSPERDARAAADSAKQATASASSQFVNRATPAAAPSAARAEAPTAPTARQAEDTALTRRPPAVPFGPWPWLGAAVLCAGLAIALQRRLTH